MREPERLPKLVKEVEPPQPRHNGVAVMLVATTAMFFAVAASALVLRARMMRECSRFHDTLEVPASMVTTAVPSGRPAPTAASGSACGEPVYRSNPDGSVTVLFQLCSPGDGVRASDDPYSSPGVVDTFDRIRAVDGR
jgi:hypothetical protein